MKPLVRDLLLILHPDAEALRTLRTVAENLNCDWVEAHTPDSLDEVLTSRRPTIALLSISALESTGLSIFQALANSRPPPVTYLIGSAEPRLLSSITRAAEARGIKIIGASTEPLDPVDLERTLTNHLAAPPPIPREELQAAIAGDELILHYQPKIALSSDELTIQGVEALIRWQHPRRGLLHPRHFLGAVEQHDLMTAMTEFVMTEAFRQAGQWHAAGLLLDMVINLSLRLVRDGEFPDRLGRLLDEHGVPAANLVLDTTEASEAPDKDLMLEVFTRLRLLGVGIALDNFGTGLSSLTDLYRMPYSEIKVDHALIADVPRERDAMLIVRAIADLAHTLQLAVCAEGIENPEMLEFARSARFDTAQGRLFSGPVPASEVEQIVRTWPDLDPVATRSRRAIFPLERPKSSPPAHPVGPEGDSSS